jgi:hypothetical protein
MCAYFQECRTEEKYKTNEKEKKREKWLENNLERQSTPIVLNTYSQMGTLLAGRG